MDKQFILMKKMNNLCYWDMYHQLLNLSKKLGSKMKVYKEC